MAMRTKKDFVKFLAEAGYVKTELEALSLPDLKALYKEEKTKVKAGASFEGVRSTGPQGSKDEAHVYDMTTTAFVRTYSLEIHGKEFRRLAKMFCEKHRTCFIKE